MHDERAGTDKRKQNEEGTQARAGYVWDFAKAVFSLKLERYDQATPVWNRDGVRNDSDTTSYRSRLRGDGSQQSRKAHREQANCEPHLEGIALVSESFQFVFGCCWIAHRLVA
jgi:hypothetical protein